MSHKVSSCEVLVAGGGIIGSACARAAAARGLRVIICEPGPDPTAASAASAGILAPQIESTDESLRALGLGARTMATRVNRITTILGRATGVEIPAGKIKAEHVVIAAGAWSPQIDHLPRHLPVEPVRGQMAAAPWPMTMPRTVLYYDHAYVLARGGEALFGSTMEHVGFHGGVTARGIGQIVAAAARLLPSLPATPTRAWSGLRPLTPDGRPIVGPDPDVRGLWYATGHGRNGVLLAGLTGDIIASLITTGASEIEIASLAPERFSS